MRINVYAEELTDEVTLVTKTVKDDEFGERKFYGVRLYLKSPADLHHSKEDDDRTAITVWIRGTELRVDAGVLRSALQRMLFHLEIAEERQEAVQR